MGALLTLLQDVLLAWNAGRYSTSVLPSEGLELMAFSLKPVASSIFPFSFPATSNPPLLLAQPGRTIAEVDFYVPVLPCLPTSSPASLQQLGLFPKDLAENADFPCSKAFRSSPLPTEKQPSTSGPQALPLLHMACARRTLLMNSLSLFFLINLFY